MNPRGRRIRPLPVGQKLQWRLQWLVSSRLAETSPAGLPDVYMANTLDLDLGQPGLVFDDALQVDPHPLQGARK